MARTKQTARASTGGKAPRRFLSRSGGYIKPYEPPTYSGKVYIDTFRNHIGPFPLSNPKHYTNNNDSNNKDTNIYKRDGYKPLKHDGIWQYYLYSRLDREERPDFEECWWEIDKHPQADLAEKLDNFEYIDVAFDILDNKCDYLPSPIKCILKQCQT